jgi:hypothetical protein
MTQIDAEHPLIGVHQRERIELDPRLLISAEN